MIIRKYLVEFIKWKFKNTLVDKEKHIQTRNNYFEYCIYNK